MRRSRAASLVALNSQKVFPARSWPKAWRVSETSHVRRMESGRRRIEGLTDKEHIPPWQAKALPLEPQAVHHSCIGKRTKWVKRVRRRGEKAVAGVLENIRNVIGGAEINSPVHSIPSSLPSLFCALLYVLDPLEANLGRFSSERRS